MVVDREELSIDLSVALVDKESWSFGLSLGDIENSSKKSRIDDFVLSIEKIEMQKLGIHSYSS